MNFIKTRFYFLLPALFCFAFSALSSTQSQRKCKKTFQNKSILENYSDLPLFQDSSIPTPPVLTPFERVLYQKVPDNEIIPPIKATAKQKEEVIQRFSDLFQDKDFDKVRQLVHHFPFLKDFRFTDPDLIDSYIEKKHQAWCPMGWSPLQIATYTRDSQMLDVFLGLDFNIRTKKKQGGESLEDNPLHISIKRNFEEGAREALAYEGYIRFKGGRGKKRLIDEKSLLKKTPWALAVEQDLSQDLFLFTPLIARYDPSGYIESYYPYGPGPRLQDGFEIAKQSGHPGIITLAYRHLKAPNYEEYKGYKKFGHRTKSPSSY